jgi:hypothetical protein
VTIGSDEASGPPRADAYDVHAWVLDLRRQAGRLRSDSLRWTVRGREAVRDATRLRRAADAIGRVCQQAALRQAPVR